MHTVTNLIVFPNSADKDAQKGKKTARKTTRAGGSGQDLQKIAKEQQAKLEKEKEERKEQMKASEEAAPPPAAPTDTPVVAGSAASKPSKNAHKWF